MQDWDREIVKVQNNPAGKRQIPPDYFEYWAPEYRAARHEVLADTLYRNRKNMKVCKDLDIAICGPKLGAKPKPVDAKQRRKDTDAENRRGAIERRFAFLKGPVGLDLVNTRTAESLAVKVDQAVVLSNALTYLRVFGIPIFISATDLDQTYHFRYKFTTSIENMAA